MLFFIMARMFAAVVLVKKEFCRLDSLNTLVTIQYFLPGVFSIYGMHFEYLSLIG